MIRPMPSPNGTNRERLYILRGRRPAEMAYDSARGLARDDEYPRANSLLEGGIGTLVEWCSENLSRKDIEKLIGELETVLSNRVEETLAGDAKRRDGRSADPAIRAITDSVMAAARRTSAPHRVNTPAMRKAADDFARIVGDLPPVRVLPTNIADSPPRHRANVQSMREAISSFAEMFPDLPPNRVL